MARHQPFRVDLAGAKLVEPDQFARVQPIKRAGGTRVAKGWVLLLGKIYCPGCQHLMHFFKRTGTMHFYCPSRCHKIGHDARRIEPLCSRSWPRKLG